MGHMNCKGMTSHTVMDEGIRMGVITFLIDTHANYSYIRMRPTTVETCKSR